MPAKRGDTYYIKRNFRGIGKVTRSLRTKSRARAIALESALLSLHAQGRLEIVRALADGKLSIEEIDDAYQAGRVDDLGRRIRHPDQDMRVAIDAALRYKAPDVKSTTLERYSTGLEHFFNYCGHEGTIREVLTSEIMQEFKAHRLSQGVSKETINNDLGAISVLASYCMARGWISARPEIRRFRSSVRIRYLEPDQLNIYVAALRKPFRTLFLLLVGSGMRLGEAEALRVCDVRFGSDGTRALVTDAKTPAGNRAVFLPSWVASALQDWIDHENLSGTDRLFSIRRRTIQAEHKRARQIAGIHEYTIHDHRHTAAVHLARAGMPLHLLQQQLGHANVTQTMRYASFHPNYSDVGEYFDRVERNFGLSSGHEVGHTIFSVENSQATEIA